jgi:hypothetical protein
MTPLPLLLIHSNLQGEMSKSYTVDMVSAIGRTALVLPRVLSSFKIESSDVTKSTLLYLNFRNRSQNVKKREIEIICLQPRRTPSWLVHWIIPKLFHGLTCAHPLYAWPWRSHIRCVQQSLCSPDHFLSVAYAKWTQEISLAVRLTS